jgi:S-adenosylmethionine synthetase
MPLKRDWKANRHEPVAHRDGFFVRCRHRPRLHGRTTEVIVHASIPFTLTSESVTEGHPDKVCDRISDAILDAHLAEDPNSRIACETLAKGDHVILAGEIRSEAAPDLDAVVRRALSDIGYAPDVRIEHHLTQQSPEIGTAVDGSDELGAGDQGLMFGYATAETPELMPLPILLAHRLAQQLADDRHQGRVPWLRPDGKTQVSVRYEGGRPAAVESILVSTQHAADTEQPTIEAYVRHDLLPRTLGSWHHDGIGLLVNPSGSFVEGGPAADCGLTGRKIIVDTYGGAARHGGGAFSGKDPSKVDRSAAYFARFVAREIVRAGAATRAELQVAYAIGDPRPFSLSVETFGTGDPAAALEVAQGFDFRPGAILERLDLCRPIYEPTAAYGHFGRSGFPWEDGA